MPEYDLKPVSVPKINTRFRTIKTAIPVPQSIPILKELRRSEPRSMSGQPPVLWHKAEGSSVSDKWGNKWIDWSSGVLITNVGHGHPAILKALREMIDRPLLATYVFPHVGRAEFAKMLRMISPDPKKYRVFLLSTGSEATENCIKLSKTYAMEKHGPQKKYFVSFGGAFHGRTMGAQLAGGNPDQKKWMGGCCPLFVQVPFPDGFRNENTSFDLFLKTLKDLKLNPKNIAGVMVESYQGGGPNFMPVAYAKKLAAFCRKYDIILTLDEVQAGFCRTGKMFCFQHYGIKPDLIACGKGITSSLPLSAVIGREDVMSLYPAGSMTSTHSASPIAVAAGIANLKVLQNERLADRAARLGKWFMPELERIQKKYPDVLGCFFGKGMVAGIQCVKPGTKTPNPDLALRVNIACLQRGLLMFAPVGAGGACIKIAPPLTINEACLKESLKVFEAAVESVIKG